MKKTIKTLTAALAILLMAGMLFSQLGWLVQRKTSFVKNHDFYSQKADFDVLFFGSSHVINGVLPMELWRDEGIVSYNLGSHGAPIATSVWLARLALKTTSPKVIVLDCAYADGDQKTASQKEFLHQSADTIPFSPAKVRMMMDLFPSWDDRMEFLWDYSIYHYRWSSIVEADLTVEPGTEKGAETRYDVATPVNDLPITEDNYWKPENVSGEYIRQLAAECRKKNVQLVLTYLPHPDDRGIAQADSRGMEILAEELGIPCLNYLRLSGELMNYRSDCYDSASHLNGSGARKVTRYMGQFLRDHFPEIPDHRQEEAYADWHGDYARYLAVKTQRLQEESRMWVVLMMLSDPDFSACVYLEKPKLWVEDAMYQGLLENLGIDTAALPLEEPILLTTWKGEGQWAPLSDRIETPYGDAQLVNWQEKRIINWNEESQMQMEAYSDRAAAVVRNADTGEVVLRVQFDAEQAITE